MLLARQQGLDVVLLGLEPMTTGQRAAVAAGAGQRRPAVSVRLPAGAADSRVPTARAWPRWPQVVADDAAVAPARPGRRRIRYPVTADDLKHVVALVEASPQSLSRRMALVESRLTGKHKMVLTSPGSALAERVKKIPHVSDVQLWHAAVRDLAVANAD